MFAPQLQPAAARMAVDGRLLFATRITRLFAFGFLSVVLVLYLAEIGHAEGQIGLLLTLALAGDAVLAVWMTTHADRLGRRRMLLAGAGLMLLAGALFAVTNRFWLLALAATLGVISPSGNEVGPFLPIEQAALAQLVPDERRTGQLAWYNLAGSLATAAGALASGFLVQGLQRAGVDSIDSYRAVVLGYAALGAVVGLLSAQLSPAVEAGPAAGASVPSRPWLGLHRSRGVVLRLSALFALDAFAGGFIVQSMLAYWFHVRYGLQPAVLGSLFFWANLLAGLSALAAGRLAARIGLIRTMVFTHLPSNVLLMLVPLMPSLPWAVGLLLVRFSISQMDVPARQSYTLAVVDPGERSAAAGVTGAARTAGAALAPMFAGLLLGTPALLSAPFLIAGGLKIVYDLALYRRFQAVRPPEELS